MRPRGEIRQALADAAAAIAAERIQRGDAVVGATWRDMAVRACVGFDAAHDTVKNMARGGELVRTGSVKVQGARRPLAAYAPPSVAPAVIGAAEIERLGALWSMT